MDTCQLCDCSDPTAIVGLAADCDCQCHKSKHGQCYSLHVNGMFGRNRKVKWKSFELYDCPQGPYPGEVDLTYLSLKKLQEIKAKPGCQWNVTRYPCEYKPGGPDFTGKPITYKIIGITEGVQMIKDEVRA